MKITIEHPSIGKIVFEESLLSGKRTLSVNDISAEKTSKNEFLINNEKAVIKGNLLFGVTLFFSNQTIQILQKPKIYEYILALLPIIFLLVWGNSVALCSIFPLVGGAIGGFIGGLFAAFSLLFMVNTKECLAKILIGLGMFALAILAAYIVAMLIIL